MNIFFEFPLIFFLFSSIFTPIFLLRSRVFVVSFFVSVFFFKRHAKLHTLLLERALNIAFADRSNLRAHMQTHSAEKCFECQRCHKTFALKSYLNKHLESSCFSHDNDGNGGVVGPSSNSLSALIDDSSSNGSNNTIALH